MKWKLLVITAVVSILFICTTLNAELTKIIDRDRYEIYAIDTITAQETEAALVQSIADAETMLSDTVQRKISVFIPDTRDEFTKLTRGAMPDWGIGCAIPSKDMIVIISSRASGGNQPFAEIVRHEWGHIALRHKVGNGYLPRFLDEGFAMNFANQWNVGYAITLAKAQLMGSLFSLRKIDRVNFFNPSQAQIAYAQSYQAVSYYISEYGRESFDILLAALRDDATLDHAFRVAIGADFNAFEEEYILYIKKHYSWLLVFSDMTFIWIGLALLIILGFLLKKKHGKDTIKRWEEEEKYESTDFDYEEGDRWD